MVLTGNEIKYRVQIHRGHANEWCVSAICNLPKELKKLFNLMTTEITDSMDSNPISVSHNFYSQQDFRTETKTFTRVSKTKRPRSIEMLS